MKGIDGRARSVRELLDGAKFAIDFYQREYAWQERQVRELIDDLTGKFLDFWGPGQARHEVEHYGHYFLGSVVVSHKRNQRFVVDGQQRLTTLSLLLIFLHHLQGDRPDRVDVRKLVYGEKFGRKSFNLDVPDRLGVMDSLLGGAPVNLEGASESVRNIAARYANIADHFPEEVHGVALPFFVDWLLENVHLVEIEAFSDEDAYTIFETMNDRGLSLSLAEMLKGYVLANIRHEDDQRTVNALWKQHMQAFKDLGEDEDLDFFKNWLRARHAETIRPGEKGAENKDFERIGSEFHRWVRDQRDRLGLVDGDAFLTFVKRDLDFYARQTQTIRRAARSLTPGLEAIRYTEERGFTLQTQLLLAPLDPADSPGVTRQKLQLVANFLDIWLARRVWCFRTIAYSSVRYTLFNLTRDLRGKSVPELSQYLRGQLDAQPESFARSPRLRLHNQNYRQVRHILARLTGWVDARCGLATHFEDLVSEGRARPFEIEHIWADKPLRHTDWYEHPTDFDTERNRVGGLLLLQRGLNQSLGDATYEAKRDAYVSHGQNLLARSLHPFAYQNNPAFTQLLASTGLPFRYYDTFGPADQAERQALYVRIAEWVWNPSRVDLDGEKPPVHEPLQPESGQEAVEAETEGSEPLRYGERFAFWTALLEYARTKASNFDRLSAGTDSWIGLGAGRAGLTYNFVVLQHATRVELYINTGDRERNKDLFDKLYQHRAEVEATFGGPIDWQRLDDKRTCRIYAPLERGGWAERERWPGLIEDTVAAFLRFRDALHGRVSSLT
ncbi:MAG: DUF4268 domain-containing protein [Pseudomonadota bacterium]|nr:DUF4268 domain-containing protein [Pseudomonadota bacterium]